MALLHLEKALLPQTVEKGLPPGRAAAGADCSSGTVLVCSSRKETESNLESPRASCTQLARSLKEKMESCLAHVEEDCMVGVWSVEPECRLWRAVGWGGDRLHFPHPTPLPVPCGCLPEEDRKAVSVAQPHGEAPEAV